MNRNSFLAATASLPLFILLAGCAPMHDTRQSLTQQTPSSHIDSSLPTALKNGWPDSQWWKAYHDAQLDALIDNAIQHSPDMQVADQRIQLAEAQAKAVEAQDGPQLDFSADIERQRMSAEGLMGPFAITDPAAGTTGPWYTNGTFGLTAGWDLDLWGKNRAEVTARLSALTNTQSAALKLRQVSLPAVESQLPSQLGYSLLARRADLQAAHWYIESSLSSIDAAKAAFYPDINLMAFLQQDALHLSDLFRHSAQQYGITGGLTLPIFDSGRLNANLDIAKAQSNLSIANYNKAVVDAVNDVARTASQVETLAQKNQHQQQIEHDAQRVVGLAQARFNAGIIAGSRVSEAKIPALREQCNGLLLQGQWLDASIQLTSALGGGYHS
ncbi:TPA: multidrug resistance outer membrane protein MdtQ [Salmonella enterica subsp. houtenae serovar 1,40:z4,z23:-]